jgi:hypothetical protein
METIDIEFMTFHKDDPMVSETIKNFDKMVNELHGPIPNCKRTLEHIEIITSIIDINYPHINETITNLNVVNANQFTKAIQIKLCHKGSGDKLYSYSLMFSNITYYRNKSLFDAIAICPKLNMLRLKQEQISEDEIRFYLVCKPYCLTFN